MTVARLTRGDPNDEEVAVGRWMVRLVSGLVMGLVALFAVFLVGMRTKNPAVQDRVRRLARDVGNPRVLRRAGSPGAPASVIRHTGRVSGRTYENPVVAHPVDDDYVIVLPYGPGADWVRNVLASGSASLVHEGRTMRIHTPRVLPITEVANDLPRSEQRTVRIFGIDECLRVTPDATAASAEPSAPATSA
jgi:deazaflavin-dependent oxidoreductase (nitroreductase family)